MIVGDRVLHPEYAFGTVVDNGEDTLTNFITVKLDNGDTVTVPPDGWELAFVSSDSIIDIASLTDDELDAQLDRYRTMRSEGSARKPATRREAALPAGTNDKIAMLIELAKTDPAVAEQLRIAGILPMEAMP